MSLILTVQPDRKRSDVKVSYRLKIALKDYRSLLVGVNRIFLFLNGFEIVCNVPTELCPELRGEEISEWIQNSNFHLYENYSPTKLEFNMTSNGKNIYLEYLAVVR